jgi:hypothetical protein
MWGVKDCMGQRKKTSSAREKSSGENLAIYENLFALNQSFDGILDRVNRLHNSGLFRNHFQRQSIAICRATLQESRAWLNFEILQILEHREEHGLAYFGRIRRDLEKALENYAKPVAKKARR